MDLIINNRKIADGEPTFIIAEGGICHNGSVAHAKKLIEVAKECGADCIKFQKRNLESLFIKDVLINTTKYEQGIQYILNYLRKYELSEEEMITIKEYADEIGIMFSCTPFDIESFKFLTTLSLPFYKVGSPTVHDIFLMKEMIDHGAPMIVSVGMSNPREIDYTIRYLKKRQADFALCHCVSSYPCEFSDINLNYIRELKEKYQVPVGYSGHERGIAIATAAVAVGANIIEKHLTLDRSTDNPDNRVSLEPQGFRKLVRDIRNTECSLGKRNRYLTRSEYTTRETLSKSLVASRKIPFGKTIEMNDLTAKCPGNGLSPSWAHTAVGLTAKRDIKEDEQITPMDIGLLETVEDVVYPYSFGIIGRFTDAYKMMWQKPKYVEFHLTDSDLQAHIPSKKYDCKFSFHMPEYISNTLLDLASSDEEIRTLSVDIISRSIEAAILARRFCMASKPRIVIHPGGGFINDDKLDRQKLYDNLSRSIVDLRNPSIDIFVENMPPLPIYFGGTWYQKMFVDPEEIIKFCDKEGMQICMDISHAGLACNFYNWNIIDYLNELRSYIGHIHIADYMGTGGEGLQIEDGECPWEYVMKMIPYKHVPCMMEIWRGHRLDGYGFALGMKRLSKWIS